MQQRNSKKAKRPSRARKALPVNPILAAVRRIGESQADYERRMAQGV